MRKSKHNITDWLEEHGDSEIYKQVEEEYMNILDKWSEMNEDELEEASKEPYIDRDFTVPLFVKSTKKLKVKLVKTMEDQELRLKALELAVKTVTTSPTSASVIDLTSRYYKFLKDGN